MGWLPFLLLERSPQRSLPFICKYICSRLLLWFCGCADLVHNISVYKVLYFAEGIFCLDHGYSCQAPCWLLTHRNSVQRCERNSRQLSVLNRSLWLLCWQGRPRVLTHLITDRRPLCFLHNSASQFCPFLSDQWAIMTANRNRALTGN